MSDSKPRVGERVDEMNLAVAGADTSISIGAPKDRWTMLFVYRGKHCPRCKRFLNKLNAVLPAWTETLDVVVVSGDTE
ncbi:redoxin domain-containing protein [Meridianimarinicoccus aquatilis]|uniref:redoxin domain-containing protein n=1 Tax=Meridianimarinicoccus aquatilis TaxID=2552766 RepID=UPI001FB5B0F5|nr:redoxin domain-containing protein [Fluviibacterium aquatile]